MQKWEERHNPDSCWNKTQDRELVFILCERDPLAHLVVAYWAQLAAGDILQPPEKIAEVVAVAEKMAKSPMIKGK